MPTFRDKASFPRTVAVKETDAALLCRIEGQPKEVWIPKSQIDDDSEVFEEENEGTLIVSEWIALQKDLI